MLQIFEIVNIDSGIWIPRLSGSLGSGAAWLIIFLLPTGVEVELGPWQILRRVSPAMLEAESLHSFSFNLFN